MRQLTVTLLLLALNQPSLLAAQPPAGDVAEARRLLVEASYLIKDIPESQQPSAAANIAGQLARAGDLQDALRAAQSLQSAEDQVQVQSSIAWQLAHDGSVAQALALVDSAPNGQNKALGYALVAELVAESGDLQEALGIAHRITNDPNRLTDTLVQIARLRSKAGDSSGAREAIADALNVVESSAKQGGNTLAFTQIAAAQYEIGDKGDAFATLTRFSDIARLHQGAEGNVYLQQLAAAQAQIGDFVGAQRTAESLPVGSSDVALMRISQEQAKQGLLVDALANAERIGNPTFKSLALREIAMVQGTHGTLSDALEAIDQISEPAGRAEALAVLALQQANNENPAVSLTLQAAWTFATQNRGDSSDNVFAAISATRAMLGDLPGAQQAIQQITKPESLAWSVWNITSATVKAGHIDQAITLAQNQGSAYPKAYGLLGTAKEILDDLEAEQKARGQSQ